MSKVIVTGCQSNCRYTRVLEGTLLVEDFSQEEDTFYEFSVTPNNLGIGSRKFSDFVSSSVSEESVVELGVTKKYKFLSQSSVRPLADDNNHGDRLALDSLANNIDVFFGLIRRTGHREDLEIHSMGMRFYSSYDACNDCYKKIYDTRSILKDRLVNYAATQHYTFSDKETKLFPLHTLFYSSRPYKDTTYQLKWTDPRDSKGWKMNVSSEYQFSYGVPKYHISLPISVTDTCHSPLFLKHPSKQISVSRDTHELNESTIYCCVDHLAKDGIPVNYKLLS